MPHIPQVPTGQEQPCNRNSGGACSTAYLSCYVVIVFKCYRQSSLGTLWAPLLSVLPFFPVIRQTAAQHQQAPDAQGCLLQGCSS
jgi:hypothetical protein